MKKPLLENTPKDILRQNDGQIIVEYILLLFISVSIATLLTKGLVGRGDDPGIFITKWSSLITMIGQDIGD